MLSHDLLLTGRELGNRSRVLDLAEFLKQCRRLLQHILLDPAGKPAESQSFQSMSRRDRVLRYVRLHRGAIMALACQEDFDTIEYVIAAYNVHSQKVLEAGRGLPIGEFSILQVSKDSREELDKEIEEIRKLQEKITISIQIPIKGSSRIGTPMFLQSEPQKYNKAALFQGLEGITEFYHSRYCR